MPKADDKPSVVAGNNQPLTVWQHVLASEKGLGAEVWYGEIEPNCFDFVGNLCTSTTTPIVENGLPFSTEKVQFPVG